jgi:hypothetical protein
LSATFDYGSKVADMFQQSGCANKNPPTEMAGPWCAATCPGLAPTTASPSASPTLTPSKSPTTQYCFPDWDTLKTAVNSYITLDCETDPDCAIRSRYGLIGTWCVKHVTDMHQLFFNKASFNSDISNWDVT